MLFGQTERKNVCRITTVLFYFLKNKGKGLPTAVAVWGNKL